MPCGAMLDSRPIYRKIGKRPPARIWIPELRSYTPGLTILHAWVDNLARLVLFTYLHASTRTIHE
jgi:hypothetical protein